MTDEQLGEQLDAVDRALRGQGAGPLDVEAGLAAVGAGLDRRVRGRVFVPGRTADGAECTLVAVHQLDSSWTFETAGSPGVTLSADVAILFVESILARAR